MIRRIKIDDTILVAIDFQERLLPAMYKADKLEDTMTRLAKGLKGLEIPALVTQQYTKGLGATVSPIAEAIGKFDLIDKNTFSAWANEEFRSEIIKSGRKTVILTGIETHICVEQTTLDLLENGYTVFIAADCVQSRNPDNREISLRRMENEGAVITCYESILYELLGGSRAPEFKTISTIVK